MVASHLGFVNHSTRSIHPADHESTSSVLWTRHPFATSRVRAPAEANARASRRWPHGRHVRRAPSSASPAGPPRRRRPPGLLAGARTGPRVPLSPCLVSLFSLSTLTLCVCFSNGSTVAATPYPSPCRPAPLPDLRIITSVEIRIAPANPRRIAGPQVLRVAPVPPFSLPPDLPSLRSLPLPCSIPYRRMEAIAMDVVSSSSSTDSPPAHEPAIEARWKREPKTPSPRILLISPACVSKGTKAQLSQCSCRPQPVPSITTPAGLCIPDSSESVRSVRIRSTIPVQLLHGLVLLQSGISGAQDEAPMEDGLSGWLTILLSGAVVVFLGFSMLLCVMIKDDRLNVAARVVALNGSGGYENYASVSGTSGC